MVQTEKRLLWHPRHENKFAVGGGSQITLYEWVPESFEIKQVTSQLDLTLMKCFAWSPDATFDDLIAVGLTNGRVDLMRLGATRYARNHILSSGPSVSLPVPTRNSRACNALAFSASDTKYLAVGLDKVRQDPSLVVWDIYSAMPALELDAGTPQSSASVDNTRPASQQHIPRGDSRGDSRVLQHHAHADVVSAVAFLPSSPALLLAGTSHRWLKLFDLRTPLAAPLNIGSKVHGIATDPFEPHRIGCFGDGVVTIWDARRLVQPLLTFTGKDAGADGERARPGAVYTTLEFSSTRRGVLATLEKDAHHVRFWDLQQAQVVEAAAPERTRSRDSSQSGKATRSWTNPTSMLPWTGSSASSTHSSAPAAGDDGPPYNLVLSDTRRTKSFARPLASFALVPDTTALHPLTSNIMVVNKDGDLELYAVHDIPKLTPWSARGDLAITAGHSYRILPGFHDRGAPSEPWDIPIQPSLPGSKAQSKERRTTREESSRLLRGRTSTSGSPAPMFGRGDEDGFPALPVRNSANLSATRLDRARTQSPAALPGQRSEHTAVVKNGSPRMQVPQSAPQTENAVYSEDGRPKGRRRSQHTKDGSLAKKLPAETGVQHLVEEDISMKMRQRVIKGYGLLNPLHNSIVIKDTSCEDCALAELWRWLHNAQQVLSVPTPRLEGYNFAYQGLFGIWEGLRSSQSQASSSGHPTPRMPQRTTLLDIPGSTMPALDTGMGAHSKHGSQRRSHPPNTALPEDYLAAVNTLNDRSSSQQHVWRPAVATAKLAQRRLALQLCGWSLGEDDLAHMIKRWEKEKKHSQAACWLVFTGQYKRAVDVLMRSEDESLRMMSGMLAALTPSASVPENNALIEHCELLKVRLQDPYLRAMLTYLTVKDWRDVLDEDMLPLRESLAIAFQFLDDKALSSYLCRVIDDCSHSLHGYIEGIIVTGVTASGMDILQAYVDRTGDIQTAAILSSLSATRARDGRAGRWLEAYRDLLDGWKLFHYRCQFDIDRGRILQDAIQHEEIAPFEWAPRQILIRCNYCNKAMDPPFSEASNLPATACPHCGRPLPRCSVCLMTLSIVQDVSRNVALVRSNIEMNTMDEALVFCQTCRHGGHASHILEWFSGANSLHSHGSCPVAGCDCRCANEP
ncbi:hypothetical protein AcW1_008824 [Taiwanofungus camphoratus]|nr:hypothetical protein AcW1_008824 [Antrodia cinnamomea]